MSQRAALKIASTTAKVNSSDSIPDNDSGDEEGLGVLPGDEEQL